MNHAHAHTHYIDIYCERLDGAFWAEPINALTNLSFIAAAIWAWRRGARQGDIVVQALAAIVAAIGIGSFLFHTFATRWAGLADVVPIGLFVVAYALAALKRFFGVPPLVVALGVAILVGLNMGPGLWPFAPLPSFNGSIRYAPAFLALAALGVALAVARNPSWRPIAAATGLLGLSLYFRTIDHDICGMFPAGTHFLWHLLNGAMFALVLHAMLRQGPRAADASEGDAAAASPSPGRRWLEFTAIYVLAPLCMAGLVAGGVVPGAYIPLGFAAMFVAALLLLTTTPGFRWRTLFAGRLIADWRVALAFVVGATIVIYLIVQWLVPWALFGFPSRAPRQWAMVMCLYPVLSVLPQSITFRVLFFTRYASLFEDNRRAIAVNAAVFGLAHILYMNWVAVALTTIGGAVFAWAHAERGSFWFANLLHIFGGWAIFTLGLGVFFYHGAITPLR